MKLPDKIFGISTEEAYKRYLEEAKKPENTKLKKEAKPTPSNIQNSDSYLILPGKQHGSYEYPDLLVATERSHHNKTWYDAHELLGKEDAFMLNPRQFVDFLNLLKSGEAYDGNGRKEAKGRLDGVLDEIVTVRSPWRSEWLNASFNSKGTIRKDWQIQYYNPENMNVIKEPLEDCLRDDKTPGIDLNYWLSNATSQGLPPEDTPNGNLYYWHPRNSRVARFNAGSGRADLGCNRSPQGSDSALGVRASREK